ncbi:MAG TPA: NADH-quinone oxidoreductase subunit N [Spirochaetia bacterium]|nr:NADH-quinone oxidoreductase subunit N [Spirochaetia bacterium]
MSGTDFFALLPDIIVAGASIVIMLGIALKRTYAGSFAIAFVGLVAAFIALFFTPNGVRIGDLLIIDGYAKFFMGLIIAANLCVLLFSYGYFKGYEENREELFILLLLETLGAMVLTTAVHFASFFLGLELLSVALYALLSYVRFKRTAIESGLKYLVPAAVSSAIFLFGMALIYRETGVMLFSRVASYFANAGAVSPVAYIGLVMIIVGVGFKLALVPFHMWAADVYQGANLPATASIATVSKIGVFAMIYRLFAGMNILQHTTLAWVLTVIAVLSMLGGNWLALRQKNVKRMLAYSSTAHLGYLMLPFMASGKNGTIAAAFYLLAYTVTTLGMFGAMTTLSDSHHEAEDLDDYIGLASRRPGTAVVMVSMLLSVAGIPLTAGFMGKMYLLTSSVGSSLWVLSFALVASSGIGLFYYLKLVAVQFRKPQNAEVGEKRSGGAGVGIALALLTAVVVLLGVYPAVLLNALASIVPHV